MQPIFAYCLLVAECDNQHCQVHFTPVLGTSGILEIAQESWAVLVLQSNNPSHLQLHQSGLRRAGIAPLAISSRNTEHDD